MTDALSDPNAPTLPQPPQLFQLDPIDFIESWQQELVDCYHSLKAFITGKSAIELHDILQQKASESMRSHGDLVNGLVYGILTEPSECTIYFRNLNIVSRDGFAHTVARLQQLVTAQKFYRLRPDVRNQLFWFINELIKINTQGIDQTISLLSRQIRSGDVAQPNIKLCRMTINLLESNYQWLMGFPALIATLVYAFSRLVLDHGKITDLSKRESEFVVRLLRDKFMECSMIGRDLVRVLQDVAKIPVFRDLWSDILHNPKSLSPQFNGIEQLLRSPTPKVFLANRITFEMEARLLFILERLPFNGYSRNMIWFSQRYLNTPESESLYCDIIRFICGVFHPTNAQLASNLVPRYIFLGSILRLIRSQVVAANAKLALFYDWLFYDPAIDSIMNIEPGVLIMARSLDRYTYLTTSFIEFLAFASDAYCPQLTLSIRKSVGLAMQAAVDKGVIPSLVPIFEHPKIDTSLRRQMQQLFPQLVPSLPTPVQNTSLPGLENGINADEPETFDLDPDSNLSANGGSEVHKSASGIVDYMDTGDIDHLSLSTNSMVPQVDSPGHTFANGDMAIYGSSTLTNLPVSKSLVLNTYGDSTGSGILPGLSTINKPPTTLIQQSHPATESPPIANNITVTPLIHQNQNKHQKPQQKVQPPAIPLDPVSRMFMDETDGYIGMTDELSAEGVAEDEIAINDGNSNSDESSSLDRMLPDVGIDKYSELENMPLIVDDSGETESETLQKDIMQMLEDPSLWLFGPSLKAFVSNVDEENIEQAKISLVEIADVFAQSEAPLLVVSAVLGHSLREVEPEDVETNYELAAAGDIDSIEHDLIHVLFVAAHKYIKEISDNSLPADPGRRLLALFVRLTSIIPDIGFRWLLFSVVEAKQPAMYTEYVRGYAKGELAAAIGRDMQAMQEKFSGLFYTVLPKILHMFPSSAPGNTALIKGVAAMIDQPQVYRLSALISTGQMKLFGDRAHWAVTESLEYDAFEQVCIWQLLATEISGNSRAVLLLAKYLLVDKDLDPLSHSEAANGILTLLRSVPPSHHLILVLIMYAKPELDKDSESEEESTEAELSSHFNLSGSAFTAWLRVWDSELLGSLGILASSVSTLDESEMLFKFSARWKVRFLNDEKRLSERIDQALAQRVQNNSPEEEPKLETESCDDGGGDGGDDNYYKSTVDIHPKKPEKGKKQGQKKQQKKVNKSVPKKQISKCAHNMRTRQMTKRRRRNVITSDDDDDCERDDSDEEEKQVTENDESDGSGIGGGDSDNNESLSDLSSISSSSPSSDDDDGENDDSGNDE